MSDLGENPTLRDAIEAAIREWDGGLEVVVNNEDPADVLERHIRGWLATRRDEFVECPRCFHEFTIDVREVVVPSPQPAPQRRRLRACVEAWPECESFGYDPRCCRFPKSCSCLATVDEYTTEDMLEPAAVSSFTPNETDQT